MSKFYKLVFLIVLTLFVSACSKEEKHQQIFDEANILKGNKELFEQYNDFNNALLEDFDIDFRVITTMSDEDINLFANKRFKGINSQSKSGKTVLLVINPLQDSTRLEVSLALEGVYTDAFVSYIERKGMVPYFRDSKIADGIYMMSELIRDRASEAAKGKEFMPSMTNKSIGGGAKTKANIGQKDTNAKAGRLVKSSKNDTPQDVYEKYLNSLREHNKNPNLEIFTKDTQEFFSKWTVTDINQDHEIELTSRCKNQKYYYSDDGYAVLMYPLKPRTCSPYFFKVEDGKWKLDVFTMAKTIRFNKEMMWHFDMKEKSKYLKNYEFVFSHYNYDKNGYPFYKTKQKLRWGFTCSPWYKPNERDKLRCMITWLDENGKAKNELGFEIYDRVMAVSQGENRIEDISFDEFMKFMKTAVPNEKIYVDVIRKDESHKTLSAVAK
jgi:uncharacterized protein